MSTEILQYNILFSESLSSDPSGQLDVSGHDGDPSSMDGAEVRVFKQSN